MRKTLVFMMAIAIVGAAKAQFDASKLFASVSGNYTMYKGDFQQKTPGVKLDIGYSFTEKIRGALGYTYHLPIKVASSVSASNELGSKSIPSEVVYNFSTISLLGNYTFGESEDNPISFYAPLGIGYVMAKYKEELKESMPPGYTAMDLLPSGSQNGFILNFGLGGQYNFASARAFADASLVLAANKVNDQYVENYIPPHFAFNLGIRIPFGDRGGQ